MVRLRRRVLPSGDGARPSPVDEQQLRRYKAFKADLTGRKGELAVSSVLDRLGRLALHDIILPDAAGLTQVDHLVLGDTALLVLETKTLGGAITGSPADAEWYQHLNDGAVRTRFQNPLRQNFRHCRTVERLVELAGSRAAVIGHIVSTGRATFATELRSSVVDLTAIADLFPRRPVHPAVTADLRRVWEVVGEVARRHEARRGEHRAGLSEKQRT